MIGDVQHKRGAKAEAYKVKNSKGRSHKTIAPGKEAKDDDGDAGTSSVARRMTKGMKPGPGRDKQDPGKQQSRQLSTLDLWCQGKKDCYK
jgi:hypothetical protein